MDYNATFTKNLARRKQAGMTLTELMIAMAVSGLILAVVGSLALWSGKSFAAMANYTDLDNASRNALDSMTREIRQVEGLYSYTTNLTEKELALRDSDGQLLYFRYNAVDKTLKRVKVGEAPKTLLKDCTLLDFNLYQRNNVSNSFNQYEVASGTNATLTCKVIQVNWICTRRLLPTTLLNSESVQTAKIVIRHH